MLPKVHLTTHSRMSGSFTIEKGSKSALPPAPMAAGLPSHLEPPDSPQYTATPSPHRGIPKHFGQPETQVPVDDPHAEVAINPQWTPRAEWVMKRIRNLSNSCTSCRLNPHDQYRSTLSMEYIKGQWESTQKKSPGSGNRGQQSQLHRGVGS